MQRAVFLYALAAGLLVALPIPITDLLVLFPLQVAMMIHVVAAGLLGGRRLGVLPSLLVLGVALLGPWVGLLAGMILAARIPVVGDFLPPLLAFLWTFAMGEVALRSLALE